MIVHCYTEATIIIIIIIIIIITIMLYKNGVTQAASKIEKF